MPEPSDLAPVLAPKEKPSVVLAPQQVKARDIVLKWYHEREKHVCTVAGYAGTGKSTIVENVIECLELSKKQVAFVTFTGKASLVLNSKGVPATTIHKLIYIPIIVKYRDAQGRERERVSGFRLVRAEELEKEGIKLIVIDEVSMVGGKLLADVLSFGIPILALGDPEQLPPVQDTGNRLLDKPDAFLTEIHRQAADNPILWASMVVRQGYTLPYGVYGGTVVGEAPLSVIPRHYLTAELLLAADQVICGRNETRRYLNTFMRKQLGREGLPVTGDKLICLKNNWDEASTTFAPLVNGWIGRVLQFGRVNRGGRTCVLSVEDWDDPANQFHSIEANLDFFEADPDSAEKPNTHSKVEQFDFGNAITTHKSQGSEFGSVVYVHEPFGNSEFARRLEYTGITRAVRRLTIVR